jgi:hypothetical protein
VTRDEWAAIERGDQVRDRQGRQWTATADARDTGRDVEVILRSGDLVRRLTQWDADRYEVIEG